MQTLRYVKVCDQRQLQDELSTAGITGMGDMFTLSCSATDVTVVYPDGMDSAPIITVITAHVPDFLGTMKQQALKRLKHDCDSLAMERYPLTNQLTLILLLLQATMLNKTAALSLLGQVQAWSAQLTQLYYVKAAQLNACTTVEQVAEVVWSADLDALGVQDPQITILAVQTAINQ